MAFFGSKSYERDLKRSFSTDRLRRGGERTRTDSSSTRATSITVAQLQTQTQPHTPRMKKTVTSVVDEFGIMSSNSSVKEDPPSLTFSTTSASASLPTEPVTPVASPSLSVPVSVNGTRGSPSSSSSSLNKQPSPRMRTVSGNGSGSKHSSQSSKDPSRRRTPQLDVDGTPSPDRRTRPISGSSGSKRGDAHSSSELKVEHAVPKSRSRTSLREQAVGDSTSVNDQMSYSSKTPTRPPRGARPPDLHASSSQLSPSPSSRATIATTQKNSNAHVTRSASSPSSPFPGPSYTGLPLRQHSAGVLRQHDSSSLSIPLSNPNSASKKSSSCGNASDSSYGSPFAEFGVGSFSVKSLLSKPAAASSASTGVRSEPDTSVESYDSYGAYGLAVRRRRVEGRSTAPETPSSVYSVTGTSMSLREHPRKPTTSDPETPRDMLGSLGRARGLEWGHVLNRERESEKEKERERERGNAHAREGSSYSLSSPSEGAAVAGYPYGLALERAHERRLSKNTKPVIQLATGAVKRLSALGVREADRGERSHSPGTPMTFGPSASPIPSPLSGSSANLNVRPRTGRASGQPSPSPTTSATVVRRAESPMPPVGLTPAEIVAHQYKEQERRRAELEREMTRDAEVPERIHTAMKVADLDDCDYNKLDYEKAQSTVRVKEKVKDKDKERNSLLFRRGSANAHAMPSPTSPVSPSSHKSDGEPPTPYYTLFGEPTGRVVAIGSARDSAFNLFDRAHEHRAKAIVAEISTKSTSVTTATTGVSDNSGNTGSGEEKQRTIRRKLSRKMSGKFKRDGSVTRGGGGGGGRESGKDSSEGRSDEKLDVAEMFAAGGASAADDWLAFGTEVGGSSCFLRTRPSLTLNTTSAGASGRRSATLPRERSAAPVKMSMDSFVAVQSVDSSSGGALPSATNGALPSAFAKTRSKDERDREKEKEKEKGKLWGLMRRISSNTLKDKYKRTSTEAVPPVPALPREIPSSHASPTFNDEKSKSVEESTGDRYAAVHLATPPSSRSPSRRPSTAPVVNLDELGKDGRFGMLRKKPSIGQVIQAQLLGTSPTQTTATRPSMATRSPSPLSSDMGFSYKRSDVSSATSCGDVISTNGRFARGHPVLVEHILPPETLCMFDDFNLNFDDRKEDDVKSEPSLPSANVDGYDSLPYSEEPMCHQALPVPPRRPPQPKGEAEMDGFRSGSPTIPSFSADNAINAFGYRKRAATSGAASVKSAFTGADFGTAKPSPPSISPASSVKGTSGPSEPPPRPPRSARRGPPGASSALQSSNSNSNSPHSASPSPSVTRTMLEDRAGRTSIGAHSQASTARPSPSPSALPRAASSPYSTPSPPPPPELLDSQSPVSASDSASSTMTFRDMSGVSGKPILTEKEKVDKWNDLLDRSEKAGGTLHVGLGDALLSDQLRESAYEPTDSVYSDY